MADDSTTKIEISNTVFLLILFAVVISWILVQLWTTAIEAFFYSYVGMSEKSAWHTFLVAAFFTIVFIIFVACSGQTGETVKSNLTGITLSPAAVVEQIYQPSDNIPE